MKKAIALILCIVMVFMLVGCDKEVVDGIVEAVTPTITFETNGGSSISPMTTAKLTKAPTPTKEHYAFDGWFLDRTLTQGAVFPMTPKEDITLYARWVKVSDVKQLSNCKIKFLDDNYSSSATFNVSPAGFDFDRLKQLGVTGMQVTVYYTVHYKKDYDVLWDIGYAGSPKYEVTLVNSNLLGNFESDLTTTLNGQTRTITVASTFDVYDNKTLTLTFSTDNIQNIIYFSNIYVTYSCGKIQ